MKKALMMAVVVVSVLLAFTAWAQFKDGEWEITTQVQLKGIPQQMPPTTYRQCITKKDAVPKQQDKNYDCKTTSQKISGNTISYTSECSGPEGKMTISGKNTYTGNSMKGTATTKFKMQGQPAMEMTSKMTGKYIGPCQ